MPDRPGRFTGASGRTFVATILAFAIATAINLITVAVLWDAIRSEGPGLSENATQILTTAFGGIIGVLGSYIGFRAGADDQREALERARPSPAAPQGLHTPAAAAAELEPGADVST